MLLRLKFGFYILIFLLFSNWYFRFQNWYLLLVSNFTDKFDSHQP